jgi:hypothetical protein
MGSEAIDWQTSLMSLVWPVILAAQIACIIHVVRTGRPYWWIWLIFMVPAIGIAVYLYLEVRPSLGRHWFQTLLWKLKSPSQRIALLETQLAESTTIRNRLTLAEELHAAGLYDRECQVLEEGLRGAFSDDPTLLMRLAEGHLEAGRVAEAVQLMAKVTPEKSPDSQLQYALLLARIDSRQGAPEAAAKFEKLLARRQSEAPRYYYAEHLLQNGDRDKAANILKDILYQYRRGTVVWRYQERRWYQAAKRLLKKKA